MKKYLFLAIALVASTLVFTSCEKNDPNAIKGIKFCCDLDRGQTPVREYLYFGEKDDFEWGIVGTTASTEILSSSLPRTARPANTGD